jgi:hypothetical protein
MAGLARQRVNTMFTNNEHDYCTKLSDQTATLQICLHLPQHSYTSGNINTISKKHNVLFKVLINV